MESVFEKTITVEEQEAEEKRKEEEEANKKKDDDETKAKVEGEDNKDGGWANLGDTISSFFNKGRGLINFINFILNHCK